MKKNAKCFESAVKLDCIYNRINSALILWRQMRCEVEIGKKFSKVKQFFDTLCFHTSISSTFSKDLFQNFINITDIISNAL